MDIHIVHLKDDRLLRTGTWMHHPDLPEGILGAVIAIPYGWEIEKILPKKPAGVVDPLSLTESVGIRIKKVKINK